MITEAVILAGGFGTRLQSVVSDVPKPMAPIRNLPFLTFLLEKLYQNNFQKAVLSVGYKHEIIMECFGDSYKNLSLEYAIEHEPLGTGGAVKNSLQFIDNQDFVLLNGDTFFDVDLLKLCADFYENNADVQMSLKPMNDFDRYGTVRVDDKKVIAFEEKKHQSEGLINGGVYVLKKTVLTSPPTPLLLGEGSLSSLPLSRKERGPGGEVFSFEKDILEAQTQKLNIYGTIFDTYFIDIGIPEDYDKAQTQLLPFP